MDDPQHGLVQGWKLPSPETIQSDKSRESTQKSPRPTSKLGSYKKLLVLPVPDPVSGTNRKHRYKDQKYRANNHKGSIMFSALAEKPCLDLATGKGAWESDLLPEGTVDALCRLPWPRGTGPAPRLYRGYNPSDNSNRINYTCFSAIRIG